MATTRVSPRRLRVRRVNIIDLDFARLPAASQRPDLDVPERRVRGAGWPKEVLGVEPAAQVEPSQQDQQDKNDKQEQDQQQQDQQQNQQQQDENDQQQPDQEKEGEQEPQQQNQPATPQERKERSEAERILDALKGEDRPRVDPGRRRKPPKKPEKDW